MNNSSSIKKGRGHWARVKGKFENNLMKMGFEQTYMVRPGAIILLKGIKSRTKSYQFMYAYFMWLIKLIKLMVPNTVVNTTRIGLAMVNSVLVGYDKQVLDPRDMIKLSNN